MWDRRWLVPPFEAGVGALAGGALLFLGVGLQMVASPGLRSLSAFAALPVTWVLVGAPVLVGGLGWVVGDRRREREVGHRHYQATVEEQFAAITEREWVTRAVVQNSFDAVLILDGAGEVLDANPMAGRIFGVPLDDLVGRPIGSMLPDHTHLEEGTAVERRSAGGERLGLEWRTRARHSDGSSFPVDLHIARLPEPNLVVYAIREATTRLEQEQSLLREALLDQQGRTVSDQRRRGVLLLDVDHGLRDGVERLLARAEVLRDSGRKEVRDILDEGHALLDRLELLWSLTMWERSAGQPTMLALPVVALVDQVAEVLGPLSRRFGGTVEMAVGSDVGEVVTDGRQLAGALRCLCVEALRRSPGRVRVEAVREPGRGTDWLSVFVACEGAFLTDLDEERLARAFQSAEDAVPEQDIGIALAQRLARRLGGHVTVSAAPGRPLGFGLRVPVDASRVKAPGRADLTATPHLA